MNRSKAYFNAVTANENTQPQQKKQGNEGDDKKPNTATAGKPNHSKHQKGSRREPKKSEEKPTETTAAKEKECNDELICPYCKGELVYSKDKSAYIHKVSKGCKTNFATLEDIEIARNQAEAPTKQQPFGRHSEGEDDEDNNNKPQHPAGEVKNKPLSNNSNPNKSFSNNTNPKKNQETSEGIEVIEMDEMDEEALKAKLGLLEKNDKSEVLENEPISEHAEEPGKTIPDSPPITKIPEKSFKETSNDTQENQEPPESPEIPEGQSRAIGKITSESKGRLRDKIMQFEQGEEVKMEKYAEKVASEEIKDGSKRAILMRNGVIINESTLDAAKPEIAPLSNNSEKAQTQTEEKEEKMLENTEIYSGKTTLLTENVPAEIQKIFPSITDIETGEIITIEQPETLIGRDKECQIIINDKVISHKHAYIILKNDKAYMIDNGSSNGTFVMEDEEETNKFKLPEGIEVEIKDGSIIMLADRKYKFSLEG